jgi:hypothetical protein
MLFFLRSALLVKVDPKEFFRRSFQRRPPVLDSLDDGYLFRKASPHDPIEHWTIRVEQAPQVVRPSLDVGTAASAPGLQGGASGEVGRLGVEVFVNALVLRVRLARLRA